MDATVVLLPQRTVEHGLTVRRETRRAHNATSECQAAVRGNVDGSEPTIQPDTTTHADCQRSQCAGARHKELATTHRRSNRARSDSARRFGRIRERLFDLDACVAHAAPATFLVPFEAAANQTTHGRRHACGDQRIIDGRSQYLRDRIGGRLSTERRDARQHLIEHHAERPDVCFTADDLAACLFGTHVGGGADDETGR